MTDSSYSHLTKSVKQFSIEFSSNAIEVERQKKLNEIKKKIQNEKKLNLGNSER